MITVRIFFGSEAGVGRLPVVADTGACAVGGGGATGHGDGTPALGCGAAPPEIGIVETTSGAVFGASGTSTGCSSRETIFSVELPLAVAAWLSLLGWASP